ncbi:uracil-xanthine permease [Sedimentibacter sp. zth1]|uniref:uracil-xanthine permease family protein n=1 Tax=Sedimentibacter sp. zth1 TaxID=2816908 RepID=UPI001A92469C|nr:uracil-xanthine permease family protein [Sedimentibacter sp. zth1]QSX05233.1 uracil-xanthine permease [Sedimentibacter sp. zth1]
MNTNYSEKIGVKNFILGIQHLLAMFGATVLVPMLTGLDISVALFSSGVGTLIFHCCTKFKVPVFLGSSFAFIPPIVAVIAKYGSVQYAQGGIMVAGLIYVIFSLLVNKIGVKRIRKLLPGQVVGPMIIVIGLNLVPVAFDHCKTNFLIAFITLGSALCISKFAKGFIKQLNIILAIFIGYLLTLLIDNSLIVTKDIAEAAWFSIPSFTLPKFDVGAIMMIAPIVIAVFMEHIGDITTNGQVVGKDFIKDPGLNRTLLGDGLATIFASLIGGPANTTYGENTGVLAMTKNYNPRNLEIAAAFAILLSFIGKVSGFLGSIPEPVMGGISLMLYCMISLIGVKTIKLEKVKFNWKNIITMLVILFIGLYATYLQKYLGFNLEIKITEDIPFGGLSLAAVVGILVNLLLNKFLPWLTAKFSN